MSWTDDLTLHQDPVPHYSMKQIEEIAPPNDWHRLCLWLRGQTMIMAADGSGGVYEHDFERWLRQGKKIEQGGDWD
jgi:hypothetical protein